VSLSSTEIKWICWLRAAGCCFGTAASHKKLRCLKTIITSLYGVIRQKVVIIIAGKL
jgi:hypothetical protein